MIRKIFAEKRWKRKYRRPARATMVRGLRWLSQSGIPIETVLDVGAAIGGWSKKCMDYFPTANYVLFEPNPGHHKALNEFARSSTSRNITIVEKAAGANEGTVPFVFDPDDLLSGAVTKESASSTIEVELTSIDSALSGLQTEPPFLLKLDTHGFEREILKGAAKTLEQTNVLIIEAYNYRIREESFLFWELCAYLSNMGFRPVDLVDVGHRKYDGSLWQMDLFFISSSWEGFNYISYK